MGLFLRSIAQLSLTFVTLTGEPKQVLVDGGGKEERTSWATSLSVFYVG